MLGNPSQRVQHKNSHEHHKSAYFHYFIVFLYLDLGIWPLLKNLLDKHSASKEDYLKKDIIILKNYQHLPSDHGP